jgi:hypothetical protein
MGATSCLIEFKSSELGTLICRCFRVPVSTYHLLVLSLSQFQVLTFHFAVNTTYWYILLNMHILHHDVWCLRILCLLFNIFCTLNSVAYHAYNAYKFMYWYILFCKRIFIFCILRGLHIWHFLHIILHVTACFAHCVCDYILRI